MAERTEDVQAHWTRPGVLARIDAALTELGHDPQNLSPEILATLEHLHSGGLATTRRQANRIAVTEDSRVLDVGCGARRSASTCGRPPRERDFHRQYRRKPARCQRTRVSGRMIVMAWRLDGNHRDSMTKNKRSPFVTWTRPLTLRCSTIS